MYDMALLHILFVLHLKACSFLVNLEMKFEDEFVDVLLVQITHFDGNIFVSNILVST